jgi:hypothetical protein
MLQKKTRRARRQAAYAIYPAQAQRGQARRVDQERLIPLRRRSKKSAAIHLGRNRRGRLRSARSLVVTGKRIQCGAVPPLRCAGGSGCVSLMKEAETAARCGFKVPVLEGARSGLVPERKVPASLNIQSARVEARGRICVLSGLPPGRSAFAARGSGGSCPGQEGRSDPAASSPVGSRLSRLGRATSRTGRIVPERHSGQRRIVKTRAGLAIRYRPGAKVA